MSKGCRLVSRSFKSEPTVVKVGGVSFGGNRILVIAGPCAVEGEGMLLEAARKVKSGGAKLLRGGAYKPRTSPYSFQGLREEGLRYLARAGREVGLPVVTEIMDPRKVEWACDFVDLIQIGSRNMQNYDLLREVGRCGRPVLLKRGFAATVEELLFSAEYIAAQGNMNIILCERGIRTFACAASETSTRNTLDLSAVPLLRELTHLPVIVDPSHATGRRGLVSPMALAAVASGADGLIVEVHPRPEEALCDGRQSLTPSEFAEMMDRLKAVARAVDREI